MVLSGTVYEQQQYYTHIIMLYIGVYSMESLTEAWPYETTRLRTRV